MGGGGGVDIGSGLLYELTAGYRYQVSPLFAITAEAGGVNADKGSFEAGVFQLGINWSMQRPSPCYLHTPPAQRWTQVVPRWGER